MRETVSKMPYTGMCHTKVNERLVGRTSGPTFGELVCGDFFVSDKYLFIKVRPYNNEANAVCLHGGWYAIFNDTEHITLVSNIDLCYTEFTDKEANN